MMFATCAAAGCYNKIAYSDEDTERPRYCERCMRDYGYRRGARTKVNSHKATIPQLLVPPKMVVLVCPICKTRKTSPANLHGYIEPCETEGCSGRMNVCDKHTFRPATEAIAGRPIPIKQVILKCPVCKSRFSAPDALDIVDIPCKIKECDGVLVYARDATIPPPKKPEELFAEKQRREKK